MMYYSDGDMIPLEVMPLYPPVMTPPSSPPVTIQPPTFILQTSKEFKEPVLELQNVISTLAVGESYTVSEFFEHGVTILSFVGCKLDVRKIAQQSANVEYSPKRISAVVMRIRKPRTTALIFSSGKIVCTGAKCENQSRLAARRFARIVQKLGFDAQFLDFKVS